ncbi:hypothetical protein EON63_16205, partial [archaeon]
MLNGETQQGADGAKKPDADLHANTPTQLPEQPVHIHTSPSIYHPQAHSTLTSTPTLSHPTSSLKKQPSASNLTRSPSSTSSELQAKLLRRRQANGEVTNTQDNGNYDGPVHDSNSGMVYGEGDGYNVTHHTFDSVCDGGASIPIPIPIPMPDAIHHIGVCDGGDGHEHGHVCGHGDGDGHQHGYEHGDGDVYKDVTCDGHVHGVRDEHGHVHNHGDGVWDGHGGDGSMEHAHTRSDDVGMGMGMGMGMDDGHEATHSSYFANIVGGVNEEDDG